jgi:hypothetical protein
VRQPEKQLLLTYHQNYADEFDVEGFLVLSESDWEKHKDLAARVFGPKEEAAKKKAEEAKKKKEYYYDRGVEVEVGFGTNEEVTYHSLEDYLSSFKIKELTPEQYKVLDELFGVHTKEYSYGRGKNKVTVPAAHKIENGMPCLITEDHLDEDEAADEDD